MNKQYAFCYSGTTVAKWILRFLEIMQSKFATSLPSLDLWGRPSSSPVVTQGKVSLLRTSTSLNIIGRVGAGDCKTNDDRKEVIFQPVFPAS